MHAYREEIGEIVIGVKLCEGRLIQIEIKDKGCGIADVKQAMTPLYTSGGEDRAGLGFSVMESFCDRVRVRSKAGRGTTVTLDKYILARKTVRV